MPFTLEASRPAFYIVNASDLIAAFVKVIPDEDLAGFAEESGFDEPSTVTREDLVQALIDEQSNSGNITFGDTDYSLVRLSRWEDEYDIDIGIQFIDSDGNRLHPDLVYVNMGE